MGPNPIKLKSLYEEIRTHREMLGAHIAQRGLGRRTMVTEPHEDTARGWPSGEALDFQPPEL